MSALLSVVAAWMPKLPRRRALPGISITGGTIAAQFVRSRALPWVRRAAPVVPHPAFGLFLLAILAYAGYFTYYALSGLDLVGILRDVNNDDSFYYFRIARNLAEGQFSTFDGGITRTNGYHPVWMWLITPFYWVFDPDTALFGIKAFELCLIGGSVALLALSAWLCRLPWPALVAILPLLYQQNAALWSGMEGAAGLFALSLLFLSLSLTARQPARWWPLLAAVAFLLPWVRLEYMAISLAATAGAALLCGTRRTPEPAAGGGGRAHPVGLRNRISRLISGRPSRYAPFLGACLGIVIYFAYNRLLFGGYVPVSGAFKSLWSQQRFAADGGYDLAQNALAHWRHRAFNDELLVAAEVCAYTLIVWWVSRRDPTSPRHLLPIFLVGASSLAIGHAAKFVQHTLAVHPFYNSDWYFVPAYLMMALIVPIRCFTAVYLIKALVVPRWPQIGRLLTAGSVAAAVIALAVTVDFTKPFRFIDSIQPLHYRDWEISSYLGTQAMNGILPDDAVVGSEHAGVIGYFAAVPVVNLDGLVNTYAYYYHCRDTPAPCDPLKYIRKYGITHLAGALPVSNRPGITLFEGASFGMQSRPGSEEVGGKGERAEFKLWVLDSDTSAVGTAPTDGVWAMLQKRADYYSGDTAALVSANLAHIFHRACDPQQLDAPALVVSSDFSADAKSDYGSKLWYFWNDLRRNNLGYCEEVFELPGATEHPIRVAVKPFTAAVAELLRGNRPLIQSDWKVHRVDQGLLYYRAPCAPADTAARFRLEIVPAAARDLPTSQREQSAYYGDFDFSQAGGVRYAGRCLVIVPLPDYEIDAIIVGQYIPGGSTLWYGRRYTESYRAAQASEYAAQAIGEPAAADFFSVYHSEGALTYIRENCAPADTEAMFYLHLFPADANDLTEGQREHGFDNRDFEFDRTGGVLYEGRCLVSVPLPGYEIHGIRTGQHVPGKGQLWSSEFYTDAYFAGRPSELAAAGFFSVYHGDSALTYIREDCAPADTEAMFYLHLFPADADDLPESQRQYGFDNRDFDFGSAGGVQYEGRCLVSIPLPDYAIDRIHTGQYRPDTGALWTAEFAVEPD